MNMIEKHILILTLSTLALNAVKTEDTIKALKEVLKKLNAPNKDKKDEVDSQILYHSRHKHGNSKHGGDLLNSPNLMNVQTMNLFLKPNKRMNKDHITRLGPENACKIGRCGCKGARCGTSREDNLADEVDRVVNEINEQLAPYENEGRNNGNELYENKRDHKDDDEIMKDRGHKYFDKIKEENRDEADVDLKQERDDDDALESNKHIIFGRKDRLNKNELIYNKRIKVDENLDVVILDKSDLDTLLRNEDLIELTRKDVVKGDQNNDEEMLIKVFQKHDKLVAEENKTGRTANVVSLEDFFTLYEIMKEELVTKVMRYVRSKKQLESLNLKHIMIPTQMKKIQNLKMKYKRGEIQEEALEQKIEGILFGAESKAKVVAHNEKNNYIFVPKRIYNAVLNSKKNVKNILRVKSHKRILPLTFQQKERLFNKEKVKTIPKLVWRKNSEKDIQRLGIPFELEVHGLGQVAP